MDVVVLDNGAFSAKIGYSRDKEPKIVPNCVTKAKNVRNRIFIADQIDDCKDQSGLYFLLPFQKGYLVNWDVERQVWDHLFGKEGLNVDFSKTGIVLTEPYFNFSYIQEALNEILFEEYQFQSVLRTNASYLTQYKCNRDWQEKHQCCVVVDSGYSFTHIIPYYNGKKVTSGMKRIQVGGKILTNHLKEIISYRQLMVMDETHVINQCKEDICYVSTQFWKDMEIGKKRGKENTVVRDYVLPDYTQVKRGFVKSAEESTGKAKGDEQIIRMNNERFAVPELLFHPADIGIQEMGVAEGLVHAVSCCPEEMHPHLYRSIILMGGNCMLPGFKDRFYQDVRALAPDEYDVKIHQMKNSVTCAWEGGVMLAESADFKSHAITKQEYDEHGQSICQEKFDV